MDFIDVTGGSYTALRLEYLYRDVNRETSLLMKSAQPEGGWWSFDAENRKPPGLSLFSGSGQTLLDIVGSIQIGGPGESNLRPNVLRHAIYVCRPVYLPRRAPPNG